MDASIKRKLGIGTAMVWLNVAVTFPVLALDPAKSVSQYVLASWSAQNGLNQKSVMGVAQTSDGYIWLATEEGLVRYDGFSFRTYDEQNSAGLPDRYIRSVAASRDGSLWVGTRSGLSHFERGVFTDLSGLTAFNEDIYDLCESRDGSVWFSSDHGLHRFHNGKSTVYSTANGLPDDRITTIAQGGDGSVWVGTRAGLVRFADERFTTYTREHEALANSINALSVGKHGTVWIGTSNGEIERWNAGTISSWWSDPRHHARVQCIREDEDGNLWIAFEHFGLARMQGRKFEIFTQAEGLPSNDPDWMLEDREHSMWIGWEDAGVSLLRDGQFTSFGKREGLSSDRTTSVLQATDGSFWVGTEDGGLNHIRNGKAESFSERRGVHGSDLVSLLETRDGSIWSGSDDGILNQIKNGVGSAFGKRESVPPRITALLEDRAGTLWVGFQEKNGLARFDHGRFDHVHLGGRVMGLAEAPDGALWIAGYGLGVSRFRNGVVKIFSEKEGLSSSKAICVFADREGTIWAGTALSGLNRIKDGRVTKYSVKQGLADSTVGAIVEDDHGYLWLTSSRGISRVAKQELNDFADGKITLLHSTHYGYANGLRSEECSIGAQPAAWKAKDGTLWFATAEGLASVNPARMFINKVAPELHIDSIVYGGKAVASGVTAMRTGLGRLEINFTAPSFVSTQREHLRYRLDGYDANWIDTYSRRSASYTNLPPGSYAFRMQAANADGICDHKEAVYRFELLPEFYQTIWFRVLCLVAAGLIGWRIYLIRVRYLMVRNAELEKKVESRTVELRKAVEAAEVARELLREQATKDMLTGLWNRRAIFDILEREMVRCSNGSGQLCVLMADVDHFKRINDRYGHLAGDQVLQQAATRLLKGLRSDEAVGRYGGEEILIVFPDCNLPTAVRRAEELRILLEKQSIRTEAGEVWVTCSFGVAEMRSGHTGRDVMGAADIALYAAKAAGRNCVRTDYSSESVDEPQLTY